MRYILFLSPTKGGILKFIIIQVFYIKDNIQLNYNKITKKNQDISCMFTQKSVLLNLTEALTENHLLRCM